MSNKTGILFVCTGNICRSPTAEGVFRDRARAAGLENRFLIDSAGIEGYHTGDPPDRRTVQAARARGYDLGTLRARRVEKADFSGFDMILAMDRGHLAALERMKPSGATAQIVMFMDFAGEGRGGPRDVPDPYYGGPEDFTLVLDLVEDGVEGLLAHLQAEQA